MYIVKAGLKEVGSAVGSARFLLQERAPHGGIILLWGARLGLLQHSIQLADDLFSYHMSWNKCSRCFW